MSAAATPAEPLVIGLVHTVPALAATFDEMITTVEPSAVILHISDAWLLRTAIESGVDQVVGDRVAGHATHLAASGVDAVLVTCSSIAETVTGAAVRAGVPVLRVDAAMAVQAVAEAVAAGERAGRRGRVAVLATLASTLGPTGRLVEEAVGGSGASVDVQVEVVPGAAAAKAAGDRAGHDDAVRAAVRTAAEDADVVVLAQASMAAAVEGAEPGVPVLTSPAGGVREVLTAARQARSARADRSSHADRSTHEP